MRRLAIAFACALAVFICFSAPVPAKTAPEQSSAIALRPSIAPEEGDSSASLPRKLPEARDAKDNPADESKDPGRPPTRLERAKGGARRVRRATAVGRRSMRYFGQGRPG